ECRGGVLVEGQTTDIHSSRLRICCGGLGGLCRLIRCRRTHNILRCSGLWLGRTS
ncbi:hypothetical protein LINPERPRIM_LOCUS11519, partial [Linum perenne]